MSARAGSETRPTFKQRGAVSSVDTEPRQRPTGSKPLQPKSTSGTTGGSESPKKQPPTTTTDSRVHVRRTGGESTAPPKTAVESARRVVNRSTTDLCIVTIIVVYFFVDVRGSDGSIVFITVVKSFLFLCFRYRHIC